MTSRSFFLALLTIATFTVLAALPVNAQKVTVINIVPVTVSDDTYDDSEPHLAVDPTNPLHMAATAFTPAAHGAPLNVAPLYLSNDGGVTWTHANIIPLAGNLCYIHTCDITTVFSWSTGTLYAAWLDGDSSSPPNIGAHILRVQPFPLPPSGLTVVENINGVADASMDQPFLQTGQGLLVDALYIGENYLALAARHGGSGMTAVVNQAPKGSPLFPPPYVVEVRSTCDQDAPSVRPAVHPDGTVYAAFFRWTSCSGSPNVADVVVVRDDKWGGTGIGSYTALVDADGLAGKRVVTGVNIPPLNSMLGIERIGSSLSLAVDPNDSSRVWIAWGDTVKPYTLHVRRSTDRGVTWSDADLKAVASATNPALAINSDSRVAFLYQQFTPSGNCQNGSSPTNGCWQTKVETTLDGITWATPLVLANTPNRQHGTISPAFGDYDHMVAVGADFYGIFSAFNPPIPSNFPSGVTYQRFTSGGRLFWDPGLIFPVDASVDPYFFSIKGSPR